MSKVIRCCCCRRRVEHVVKLDNRSYCAKCGERTRNKRHTVVAELADFVPTQEMCDDAADARPWDSA